MSLRHAKQARQDRFLRMEAIVRLGKDDRMRTIGDTIRQLVVAMSGQTMHHDHILIGFADQLRIDLIGWEDFLAPGSLFFLSHRVHVSV